MLLVVSRTANFTITEGNGGSLPVLTVVNVASSRSIVGGVLSMTNRSLSRVVVSASAVGFDGASLATMRS